MKNSILFIAILSLMLFGAKSASAQDKDKSESNKECHHCCHGGWWWRDHEFCHSDFHCYRAWKKDLKREKKECLAKELEVCRPFAAERKRRKAMKKAWKRDILAAQHEAWGWGHDYWY
jgi:hypothetical protein